MKKRTTLLIRWLALMLLLSLSLSVVVGCTPTEDETSESQSESESESASESESESGSTETQTATYTVNVKSVGGLPLSDVTVRIYKDASMQDLADFGTTDKNGSLSITLKASSTYHAKLTAPEGYAVLDKYALVGATTNIALTSSVIEDDEGDGTNQPDGFKSFYKLGDVMHDFTMTDTDGNEIKLSELLKRETGKGKNGVLLNFWYTSCSYCIQEFPGLNSAYKKLAEQYGVELIAINDYESDNAWEVKNFKDVLWTKPVEINDKGQSVGGYGEEALAFPMTKDFTYNLAYAFGIGGYPTTVMIDRYGVITMVHSGAIAESKFEAMFETLGSPTYTQKLYSSMEELIPLAKPGDLGLVMPDNDALVGAFASKEEGKTPSVVFYPERESAAAEFAFPFEVVEKDGFSAIRSTNETRENSYAILYADVTLEAGQAVAFDYYLSSEEINDEFLVFVDNKNIFAVSGESDGWKTCVAFVAERAGTYTLAFCYLKSDTIDDGDDSVWLKNLRLSTLAELEGATEPVYIHRYAADVLNETMSGYKFYVDVILGSDGLYYVDKDKNGTVDATDPLLLADLNNAGTHFSADSVYMLAYYGEVVKDGVNYYDKLLPYFSYASNSNIYGVCSVNEELKALLDVVAEACGTDVGNDKEWLQMCVYYDAYGTDGERLADPSKGLAPHNAYVAVEGTNEVSYNRPLVPRGLLHKFTPTRTGVYRIQSSAVDGAGKPARCEGWIFSEDGWKDVSNPYALLTYEYCERLYDSVENVSMVYYMEEGKDYYINVAYYNMYQYGTIPFTITYLGEDYDYFRSAAQGVFTTEDDTLDIDHLILPGTKALLHTDGYYYADRNENGTVDADESRIYADFSMMSQMFSSTLTEVVYADMFNFKYSDFDMEILGFLKSDKCEGETLEEKQEFCFNYYKTTYANLVAEEFMTEENYAEKLVELREIFDGIYHGSAVGDENSDKTARMKAILEDVYGYTATEEEDGSLTITYSKALAAEQLSADPYESATAHTADELVGCIAVNEELASLLQMLMDTYVFKNVEDSWRSLCYYYQRNPGEGIE